MSGYPDVGNVSIKIYTHDMNGSLAHVQEQVLNMNWQALYMLTGRLIDLPEVITFEADIDGCKGHDGIVPGAEIKIWRRGGLKGVPPVSSDLQVILIGLEYSVAPSAETFLNPVHELESLNLPSQPGGFQVVHLDSHCRDGSEVAVVHTGDIEYKISVNGSYTVVMCNQLASPRGS